MESDAVLGSYFDRGTGVRSGHWAIHESGHAMIQNKKQIAVFACAFVLVVYSWCCGIKQRLFGPDVVPHTLIGISEHAILFEYGKPVREFDENILVGNMISSTAPMNEPIRTLEFRPLNFFHLEGGTLWVWLRKQGNDWICCGSLWYSDDVQA